jgi:exopolysaccharide biosynthesis polyprenyl glycosylphosphotransferase
MVAARFYVLKEGPCGIRSLRSPEGASNVVRRGDRAVRAVRDTRARADRDETEDTARASDPAFAARFITTLDERTLEILERRGRARRPASRGWLLRRLLLAADLLGLSLAFLLATTIVGRVEAPGALNPWIEFGIFLATLPVWIVAAKLFGLYDRDEFLTDHSTLDDFTRVLLLVTLGAFMFDVVTGYVQSSVTKVLLFWAFGILFVMLGRALALLALRRTLAYFQNAVIVGAGDIGQLVARKILQHPEYGINLVGFVDTEPKERRRDLRHLTLLGTPDELLEIVLALRVERVIIAFSRDEPAATLQLIRALRAHVQVDIVPRLFDIVGPNATMHALEAMPMLGLPPARSSPSSMLVKRSLDIVGSALLLIVTAPIFAVAAWRIKRESPGPIFFRQQRLGMNQREFTLLKFRTMRIDADEVPHREYIKATMEGRIEVGPDGLFKLDRSDAVTRSGRWLRRKSLDELPQLINVLRGDMSLVGPRPCLAYELEYFAPHHFERFLVPAGLTGVWQVTARGHSTFSDALDMDAVYARSWSLSRDLSLFVRTPLQLLRTGTT